ncbi:MAG: hypothetical protein Q4B92_06110 [Ruminococcus sp.]|nr:hypothetical protein [Ruminococcus sp.]
MSRKAKLGIVIAVLICVIGIIVCCCSGCVGEKAASAIVGFDNKCDFCGKEMEIKEGTKEYCVSCFYKYDGNIWK